MRSPSGRAICFGYILCCVLELVFFTSTMPLSTQVYKWVPANLMLGSSGVSCDGLALVP